MSDRKYRQIVKTVTETPWAILPEKLEAITELVALRAAGEQLSEEEIQARVGAGPTRRDARVSGSVAMIPIYGVIMPRADVMTEMSGGTSVDRLLSALAAAVQSKDVKSIMLDIDSPGGQVDMIQELAAEIRAARGRKPVVAIANTKAASAAYWLGSQADEFVVTPSGSVGGIGVFAAHQNRAAQLEQEGVATTLISAGKYKTEVNPFGPLSDDAIAHIQARVDEQYQAFTSDVAKGRRVSVDTVRDGFGEGRMLSAKRALKEGMVDAIETLDSVAQRLAVSTTNRGSPAYAAESPPGDTTDVHPEAATSGLSFAAELRRTLGLVEAHVATARSLADVREKQHLTGPKREQFAAIVDALGDLGAVRGDVVALLEDTDPEKPQREFEALLGRRAVRLHNQRGAA